MASFVIDGRSFADVLCAKIASYAIFLKSKFSLVPSLSVLMVGNDPASSLYVANKRKKALSVGIDARTIILDSDVSEVTVLSKIKELNTANSLNAILVQLPLPKHINVDAVVDSVSFEKDVDGFHSENVGRFISGRGNPFIPCTPQGCMYLIKTVESNISGANAVVIGRSNIVGKPMFHLLLRENCTVTLAHSATTDLGSYCRNADIVVSAVGRAGLLKADFIKPGAIVIDVGINATILNGKRVFVGDVDFSSVSKVAGALTPVPGGVGPMTIAFLMLNTVLAACYQNGIDVSVSEILSA